MKKGRGFSRGELKLVDITRHNLPKDIRMDKRRRKIYKINVENLKKYLAS